MSTYNATYYYNSNEFPAHITLQKNRLSIRFDQEKNEVFWYYDQIKTEQTPRTFFYPGYPLQSLVVLAPELATEIEQRMQKSKKRISGGKTGLVIKLFAAVVAFILLAYFVLLPWLASALANSFPIKYEKQMGEGIYASLENSFQVDKQRTAVINDFYNELNFPSDYDVRITVVKSDVANAFALPGGHIVVHDKILNGISSYEELAALLSHEFTHVQNRHSLRSLFRQLGGRIFLALLLGDAGAVTAVIVGNADNLKNLSYSRSLEKEADEEGAQLLAQRRIDCGGFVRLFQYLKKESGTLQPSEWLSSHPDLEKRMENIRENTACQQTTAQKNETLHSLFLRLKTAEQDGPNGDW